MNTVSALTTTKTGVIVMATTFYKERMRAARAEARAKREAQRETWRRRAELSVEVRRIAMAATKAAIRDKGDKVQLYSLAQLRAQAEGIIGPWLVAQAKARIVERNLTLLHKERRADLQALRLCKCHERNGETDDRRLCAGFNRCQTLDAQHAAPLLALAQW